MVRLSDELSKSLQMELKRGSRLDTEQKMSLFQQHFQVMIERMPAFAPLLKTIKNGYNEVITETVNQCNEQMQIAQEQLDCLNKENINLNKKNGVATQKLNEKDQQQRDLQFQV